jgi:hypothetical protein
MTVKERRGRQKALLDITSGGQTGMNAFTLPSHPIFRRT